MLLKKPDRATKFLLPFLSGSPESACGSIRGLLGSCGAGEACETSLTARTLLSKQVASADCFAFHRRELIRLRGSHGQDRRESGRQEPLVGLSCHTAFRHRLPAK